MKYLVVASLLLAGALALPQRRQYDQQNNFNNNNQNYNDNQNDYRQNQAQPQQQQQQQQQHFEPRPRHESTTFIPIIRFDKEQGADGSYKAAWETGNNIVAEEEGFLKGLGPDPDNQGEELHAQVQHGSYTYTSPEGQVITVHYTADEHGFRPTGDHLPTPPPVSAEVQKGLDLIYAGIKAQQEQAAREANHPQGNNNYNDNNNYNNNNNNRNFGN